MKNLGYVIVFGLSLSFGYAQEELAPLVKPEVDETQVMFRKTVWRRMNMKQKQNRPFFSLNGEVSRLLIEAVDEGLLTPYRSDSCINFMPDIIFVSNISVEREENPFVGGGFNSGGFDSFGDDSADQASEEQSDEPRQESIPEDLFSVLYLKEDVIFDRNRSRMYNYIRSLTLALPRDAGSLYNPAGFEKPIAHFRYDDVIALFRGPYADKAIYYNNQNPGQHMNMSDAFELRLFNAPIIKVSNAQDLDIRQIYADEMAKDPMSVIVIQQKYEYDLMEYESELWEY
ncbi:gliding motility associated protien GldN [Ekhidna lutea]|uniref:Gliding motility associated protien GldN n=1 Tax=Ekhidna lutea TaxID=447679 RepID=A0A239FBK0_EKHLU|nr:gliding motility protein GldN [Ekhidna lutea]SNS53878.1 gliding motility associated protien GldN [Ekhidna lutea]